MKTCTKCKEEKELSEFNKDSRTKDGLTYSCKACAAEYHRENREAILERKKKYYRENKEMLLEKNNKYRRENREAVLEGKKKYEVSNAKYELHYRGLTIDESPRLSCDGISLEVKCKYCDKYFIPTDGEVRYRLSALNGTKKGTLSMYCSSNCKNSCPIFGKRKFPEGFKKASSREVNSIVRKMCFERDDWKCQVCGRSSEEVQLHCHHIEGYTQNPRLGNDIGNVVTLCKEHHKEVHKLPGCNYHELRCNKE